MKKVKFIFLIYFFILFFYSCNNSKKTNQEQKEKLDVRDINTALPLMIIDTLTGINIIKCHLDTSFSYSLYIPKKYKPSSPSALMVFCDPHAKGLFPVKKYKTLADKYGFIFAGSYNSKNGMAQELGMQAIEMIINDVKAKMKVDAKRIYTSGFSGGARVAAAEGLLRGGIAGVIGCGAGFPSLDKIPSNKFRYITIVGNEDFNYSELYQLDKDLEQIKFPRQLIVFDGKHEWCPVDVMDEAMQLLQLYAMQDDLTTENDSIVNHYYKNVEHEFDSLKKFQNILKQFLLINKANIALGDLVHKSDLPSLVEFKSSHDVKTRILETEDFFKAEQGLREGYVNSMATKDEKWWKEQVGKMRNDIKTRPSAEGNTLKRVLNYLSLAAYMNASHFISQKQYEEAGQYLKIYGMVDPENPDVYYLSAQLNALQSKNNEALKELQMAAENKYTDLNNLESDAAFKLIRASADYEKIRQKVAENASKE